jgi:hypothetical protein
MKPGTYMTTATPPKSYASWAEVSHDLAEAYKKKTWRAWGAEPIEDRVLATFNDEDDTLNLYWRERVPTMADMGPQEDD